MNTGTLVPAPVATVPPEGTKTVGSETGPGVSAVLVGTLVDLFLWTATERWGWPETPGLISGVTLAAHLLSRRVSLVLARRDRDREDGRRRAEERHQAVLLRELGVVARVPPPEPLQETRP